MIIMTGNKDNKTHNYQIGNLNRNVTNLNNELFDLYDFLGKVINNSNKLNNLLLPDSLKGNFILYVPKQSCNVCIDSSIIVLNEFKKKYSWFNFYLVSPAYNDYMRKFMRYNQIEADIIKSNFINDFYCNISYPLLTYFSANDGFVYTIPITKDYTKPVRYYLNNIDINKLQ